MTDRIIQFKGKRIEDMGRDEMLECIRFLAGLVSEQETPKARKVRALGEVEWMRRGPWADARE